MTTEESERSQLAVSTVIFALRTSEATSERPVLQLPLVRRIREPFHNCWALPGGPLRVSEDLVSTASRTLNETTGLTPRFLEQLYTFGEAWRSGTPERVVSIVYWALLGSTEAAQASTGDNVQWFAADDLPPLAFDHNLIVDYALWRLRSKMTYSQIALAFLGDRFTLAQLREVYEAVLARRIDPANFRRTVEASGTVVATDEYLSGTPHRPPRLYRYNPAMDLTDSGPLRQLHKRSGTASSEPHHTNPLSEGQPS